MEKYRRYADAATGINPFVLVQTPTVGSMAIAALLFPPRLAAALLCALLLLMVDFLAYVLFLLPCTSFVLRLLLAPCQRTLLRCLLFALGNLSILREAPKRVMTTRAADSDTGPLAGDVVVVNMQSVWDMCVFEVAAQLPLFAVAFYAGGASKEMKGRNMDNNKKDDTDDYDTLVVMEPSPLQRWRVWWYIYGASSVEFLRLAVSGDVNSDKKAPAVQLCALQQKCERLGVPLVFFAEGTCTNGKGMLRVAPLRTAAMPRRLYVSAVDYDTMAIHTVLRPRHVLSFLFAMSASLQGSRDPAWFSPTFPTAIVRLAALGESASVGGNESFDVLWDGAKLQQALCAASRSRRPLAVGLCEKLGYVEACTGQAAGSATK